MMVQAIQWKDDTVYNFKIFGVNMEVLRSPVKFGAHFKGIIGVGNTASEAINNCIESLTTLSYIK